MALAKTVVSNSYYDFDSVMHYPPISSFTNGHPAFNVTEAGIALYGGSPPFKPQALSPGDVAAIKALYP